MRSLDVILYGLASFFGIANAMKDNEFLFTQGDDMGGFRVVAQFQVNEYLVTPGQSESISLAIRTSPWSFMFDRQGSHAVADFWNPSFPQAWNTYHHSAGQLNAAFIGNLTLTFYGGPSSNSNPQQYVIKDVGIAQGHKSHAGGGWNNWWFGCPNAIDGGSWWISCIGEGIGNTPVESARFTFKLGDGGENYLTILSNKYGT